MHTCGLLGHDAARLGHALKSPQIAISGCDVTLNPWNVYVAGSFFSSGQFRDASRSIRGRIARFSAIQQMRA